MEKKPLDGTLRIRNRPDIPGWLCTSTADEVYYFLAILNAQAELRQVYSDYVELVKTGESTLDVEERPLRLLRIDRDLLITYELNKARAWYERASPDAFAG